MTLVQVSSVRLFCAPHPTRSVLTRMATGEAHASLPVEHCFIELTPWTVRGYYTSTIGIHFDQQYKGNVYQPGEFARFDPT